MRLVKNLLGDIVAVECDCGSIFWPVKWNGYRCGCGRKVPREVLAVLLKKKEGEK